MENQSSQFEEILLPPTLLADMFGRSLVVMNDIEVKERKPSAFIPYQSEARLIVETSVVAEPPAPLPVPKQAVVPPPPVTATEIRQHHPEAAQSLAVPTGRLAWLGGFNKKVLIVVNDADAVHVGEQELALLTKMLEAVALSIGDVALVNTARHTQTLDEIREKLPASTVLFFGVEPFSMGVPMKFPHFKVLRWDDNTFLYSPSLHEINTPSAEQVNLKKSLWKGLLEVFK